MTVINEFLVLCRNSAGQSSARSSQGERRGVRKFLFLFLVLFSFLFPLKLILFSCGPWRSQTCIPYQEEAYCIHPLEYKSQGSTPHLLLRARIIREQLLLVRAAAVAACLSWLNCSCARATPLDDHGDHLQCCEKGARLTGRPAFEMVTGEREEREGVRRIHPDGTLVLREGARGSAAPGRSEPSNFPG